MREAEVKPREKTVQLFFGSYSSSALSHQNLNISLKVTIHEAMNHQSFQFVVQTCCVFIISMLKKLLSRRGKFKEANKTSLEKRSAR